MGVFATREPQSTTPFFSLSERIGTATNNFAEWSSLERALVTALEKGETQVSVFMDSELVVKQVLGIYKVKHPDLKPFHQRVKQILPQFSQFSIAHIPREKNKEADKLANLALDEKA